MTAAPALAHPLGNFTINHYNGIELFADRVDVLAIVDTAEIPTAQQFPAIDTDGSGDLSESELASSAEEQCPAVAAGIVASAGGTAIEWGVSDPTLETLPGAADLPILRLTCRLSAPADLSGPSTFTLTDGNGEGRVGWREITAVGDGVRLLEPPVPAETISDQLRAYPQDLLLSPLNVQSVTLRTELGEGSTGTTEFQTGSSADPFTRFIAAADVYLQNLIGPELTPLVGALAVLLAILLGAGHALLPGHGKTVMAAYLAGRRGSRRDALIVGATVTGTHTAGVLVLGVAISVSSAVAGEQVLRWLGVISGVLVAVIGVTLLRSALRSRRFRAAEVENAAVLVGSGGLQETAPHGPTGHSHDGGRVHDHPADLVHAHAPDHEHAHLAGDDHAPDHEHDHDHDHDHDYGDDHDHDHDHGHGHGHDHGDDHDHDHGHDHVPAQPLGGGHTHSHGFGRAHSHGPGDGYSRSGLIGMGVAGGLVPSPSALIVLLASIGLGRTAFGVALVFAYGLGMAGTLTAVGLLLVRLRVRLAARGSGGGLRHSTARTAAARIAAALPVLTALLVLLVGAALAARGIFSPV